MFRGSRLRSVGWPLGIFLGGRVFLTVLGLVLFVLGAAPRTADPILRPYFGVPPVSEGWRGALLGVWLRFDAIHYLRIAEHGYSDIDLSVFYPLYPLLVRALGILLGKDYLLGSLVVSNGCAAAALCVFHRCICEGLGDERLARRASLYLMVFPTAFFLLAPYPESLALLLALLGVRAVRHQRWLRAGVLGLACALARPQGIVISLAILVEIAVQWRAGRRPGLRCIAPAAMPLLGVAGFLAYRAWLGFPPLSEVQRAYWGRVAAVPFVSVLQTLPRLATGVAAGIEVVDLAAVLLMTALGILVARRLHPTYAAYHWALLLLNLSLVRLPQPISSQARFALGCFPVFVLLGQVGARRLSHRLILYPSLVLWALLAGEYLIWGWVG